MKPDRTSLAQRSSEDGGEAHCQVNNPALPNGVIFDWLDDVFARSVP